MGSVVGNTPLVEVGGIYAKLECTNPCGSIKDRIGKYIIEQSERQGLLKPGQTIVEATSGNTGIAYAWIARQRGYPITIVMPENMTDERKRIIEELGADLVLSSVKGSFAEAAAILDRLADEHGWFNPDQFSNPLNVECHEHTTGREIVEQIRALRIDRVHAFVAGVGTGGTLIGVGRALRAAWPGVVLAAVEPAESAVMSGGEPGLHIIGGIGDGFIPSIASDGEDGLHPMIDEIVCVCGEEARQASRVLSEEQGFCVGVSSGANLIAARRLARRFGVVVTIFPDSYAKYQSLGLEHCERGKCRYEHDPLVAP